MHCLLCRNLKSAFETKWAQYAEACSLTCYGASNQSAAYWHIEMERARAELEEHRLSCLAAANEVAPLAPETPALTEQRSDVRDGFIHSAA